MRFNSKKCYIMSIHRKKNPLTFRYSLDNHILEQVTENSYLGIIISHDLKWGPHINKMCNRASSTLGFIRRNLKYSTRYFKETAYRSLVRSVLDYASSVWDPFLKKDIDRLEGIQRKAARFVCNDYGRTSSVADLGWKPLAERRREQRLLVFYKLVNDLVAIPASAHVEFNNRNTRTSHSMQVKFPHCNSELFRNSFIPLTIRD